MKIYNQTRSFLISDKVEVADNIWKQTRGLSFKKGLKPKESLMMVFKRERKPGIWMPFMRFKIDLIFLNDKKKVVDLFETIRPISIQHSTWKIYYPKKPSKYLIEAVSGIIKKSKTRLTDQFVFR